MKIRCLAIDDEPLALRQMCAYIEKTPFLELQGSCKNAFEAMEKITELDPELLFTDIHMPELNGMELIKSLERPFLVIFTTAYDHYALDGFRVNAVDYLLKPISYPGFLKAANKALNMYESFHKKPSENLTSNNEGLFVKSDYRIVRIRFNEIKYIEGMREYVRIHLTAKKPIMTLLSLKTLEEKLPAGQFMRVHRSYIVNLNEINIIERNRIVFDNDIYISVGEQYRDALQQYVNKNFI